MKNKYLLLPLMLLLTSCDPVESSTPSESIEESSSVVESTSSTKDTSSTEDTSALQAELAILLGDASPTTVRDSITVIKGGYIYLSVYSRVEYDATNGIYHSQYQEYGLNSLDDNTATYTLSNTVYYDGYDSYTLDSDQMYVKKEEAKEIVDLEMGFNFELVEDITYKLEGYTHTLNGTVKASNANEFLSTEGKEISDIEFKSYGNGDVIQKIELVYYQNDFKVTRSVEYSYLDVHLELPKNVKNF